MLLARGELKDIVILRRHTVLLLSNLTRYYTRLQSRHRRRRRRRREYRALSRGGGENRNVDQHKRLNWEISVPAQS